MEVLNKIYTPFTPVKQKIYSSNNFVKQTKLQILERDTVSFGRRTYNNTDPNTQLYRGVGYTEIKALLNGESIEGTSYATSNPKGYRGFTWSKGGGYGNYFITFNKEKIQFSDHRDYDTDTRYLVEAYNLADIDSIRLGSNNLGELIYSKDFENGKKNDILEKQKDITAIIKQLQKPDISAEDRKTCLDKLNSYSAEFPALKEAVETAKNQLKNCSLNIDPNALTPVSRLKEANEKHEGLIQLLDSLTPQKVEEYGLLRDICKKYTIQMRNKEMLNLGFEEILPDIEKDLKEARVRLDSLTKILNKNVTEEFEIELIKDLLNTFKNFKNQ